MDMSGCWSTSFITDSGGCVREMQVKFQFLGKHHFQINFCISLKTVLWPNWFEYFYLFKTDNFIILAILHWRLKRYTIFFGETEINFKKSKQPVLFYGTRPNKKQKKQKLVFKFIFLLQTVFIISIFFIFSLALHPQERRRSDCSCRSCCATPSTCCTRESRRGKIFWSMNLMTRSTSCSRCSRCCRSPGWC